MGKSDKEKYAETLAAAYKKIMDISFYDKAAEADADDEEETPTPKEFLDEDFRS